ncbi:YndJ family protein [Tenuibacillus multivorans]|uniref:YndJ-like protein n=1 Tax=Tenuibacillus multivorans TaxID=237069 RepID=A0A1H0AR64_9BACI|nr:YndJ family protein [Tenuibacillus multivorans]GEL77859.1 membrane protein [Tenuibacillus multivorans]SDN35824.1 YndJ-like protein [Tenuibacillus multivorans]
MTNLHKSGLINIFILVMIAIFTPHEWYYLLLTVAQLVYVPLVLGSFIKNNSIVWFAIPAFLSVIVLQLTSQTSGDLLLATIYFAFTIVVAFHGIKRFLNRGFIYMEEILIDMAMMFLAIGGMWFWASEAGIDTGFSPIITWLTGIHFHYAAFMFLVFAGILGRIYKPKGYHLLACAIIIAPVFVALGITFSTFLELVSVIIYIIGIYGFIVLSFKAPFQSSWQKWLLRISFLALGVTILFSLIYAFGNWSGMYVITIDFMLQFHGLINAVVFAGTGVIVSTVFVPLTNVKTPDFPVSPLRASWKVGELFLNGKIDEQESVKGLVDDMSVYDLELAPSIVDFYENTTAYRLFARVQWKPWFKPFAAVYRLFSRKTQQINLPLSSETVEMTGDVLPIKSELDQRKKVRAWLRQINDDTTFVALYSEHQANGKTYMNIALPLPGSSMIGILDLSKQGEKLVLSSEEVGIYLAFRQSFMKLPIHERFEVEEIEMGELKATHRMRIFGLPFLQIDYEIKKESYYAL